MKIKLFTVAAILAALVAGVVAGRLSAPDAAPMARDDAAREVLYWVAPMDPNYRRDEPGRSPMGMDLVPV